MATLKVNITESITLNGSNYGAKNTLSVSGVNEVDKRVVTVLAATNGNQIYAGGTVAGQGTFISANVKYIRITNLDSSNHVILHLEGNSKYAQHRLEAGKSYILGTPVGFSDTSDIDSFDDPGETITKIDALASGGSVKLEVYVATA